MIARFTGITTSTKSTARDAAMPSSWSLSGSPWSGMATSTTVAALAAASTQSIEGPEAGSGQREQQRAAEEDERFGDADDGE